MTGCCCQVTQIPSVPDVHWSCGITYDAMFAISDWMSRCMGTLLLIFATASKALFYNVLSGSITLWTTDIQEIIAKKYRAAYLAL